MKAKADHARGGTLILGGGFGGAHVARLLGPEGATIVSPDSSMLYTPMLPGVAAGTFEPRHVAVPLREMCPHADILRGRAVSVDAAARTATVETELGRREIGYDRLIVALGAVPRKPPIPGLEEHALEFKELGDAIRLRNHVLRRLELAEADPERAERHLTFVFVGAGYAGVEALAELHEFVQDAAPHYPRLRDVPQRWVLVDGGSQVLSEVPERLANYTARLLLRRGVELRLGTHLEAIEPAAATLTDGTRIACETVVWTAGVTANPILAELGLPLDERGRVLVDSQLRVEGRDDVWALGDCARVPNAATPARPDPPTCQHALRQARALVRSLRGAERPYRYRSLGEGATLGGDKGIARVFGLKLRGRLGAAVISAYHVHQVPLFSRRLRVITDSALAALFRRDTAEFAMAEAR